MEHLSPKRHLNNSWHQWHWSVKCGDLRTAHGLHGFSIMILCWKIILNLTITRIFTLFFQCSLICLLLSPMSISEASAFPTWTAPKWGKLLRYALFCSFNFLLMKLLLFPSSSHPLWVWSMAAHTVACEKRNSFKVKISAIWSSCERLESFKLWI